MQSLLLEAIKQMVIEGNAPKTKEMTEKAVAEGCSAFEILEEALIGGMNVIGPRFRNNEIFIPEVLISVHAMKAGMDVIKSLIVSSDIQEKGIIIIGTVKGDLHDIGKNMVMMMLEGAGYKVIDLGVDVPTETFVKAIEEHKPHIVGISALLTTTMKQMKNTVETLLSLDGRPKIIVGGAPVNQEFADQIGADAFAEDAACAVEVVNNLIASH